MKLFHETRSDENMRSILLNGFRDSDPIAPSSHFPAEDLAEFFPSGIRGAGVWLADSATARAATGGSGHRVEVEIPDRIAERFLVPLSPSELAGECREFCIPAEIVNRYRVSVCSA